MQNACDVPADGLGIFALLPLHIVIGVQQLEGGGDIIFRKTASLGLTFRVCFQPVADGCSGLVHGSQLFPRLRVLHELLLFFQHGSKAAGGIEIERSIAGFRLFRLRLRVGSSSFLLGGAVVLCRQVERFSLIVQPCVQPALMDVAAQLFQRFFLGLVGQVCQHLYREPLLRVQLFRCICQQTQLFGGRQPGGTGGDHRAKATGDKGQHIACDLQHRRGHGSAGGKGIGHALRGRGHRVTDHGLRNKSGHHGFRCHDASNAAQPEDHCKGDTHRQQSAACAMAFFGADADTFHRGRLRLCKNLPEPAGHPGGVGIRSTFAERLLCIPVGITSAPLPEGLCRLSDAVVGRMDGGLAHIKGAVADVHTPALKAVGKGIGHGVAKGAQLLFQLLLYLPAFVISVIVFTIVHQNFLTLLPVHTG